MAAVLVVFIEDLEMENLGEWRLKMFIICYEGLFWTGSDWDRKVENRKHFSSADELPEVLTYLGCRIDLDREDLSYTINNNLEPMAIVCDVDLSQVPSPSPIEDGIS